MTVAPPPAFSEALTGIAKWAEVGGLVFHHDTATGSGAVFSPCRSWRYLLWRAGNPRGKLLGMGLLNPSTADHLADDPTIRQCRSRAAQAGLSGVLVWNLFAFRATDPARLKAAADPIGPGNELAIELALGLCPRTILGWGNHGSHRGRDRHVLARCLAARVNAEVLGLTARGHPRHPLYLASGVKPRRWNFRA